MTYKLELKSCHEVIDTVDVANVESIFYGRPIGPDILTVVMKNGKRLYCDEVCPINSLQEEPVSEELEEAAKKHAKCQREDDLECGYDLTKLESFIAGSKWKEEQFERNRLEHCNSISNEQAELEQKFLDEHLNKHDRMPTFLDAIEYGMRLQKEQMMEQAVDVGCFGFQGAALFSFRLPSGKYLIGSKVKVIVIKED